MSESLKHTSETELLMYLDSELSASDAADVRAHLDDCAACRARISQAKSSMQELDNFLKSQSIPTDVASDHAARARLRAELERVETVVAVPTGARRPLVALRVWHLLPLGASLAAVALAVGLHGGMRHGSTGDRTASQERLIPDRNLTPGVTRSVSLEQICSASDDDLDPEVEPATKQAVFSQYGVKTSGGSDQYQVDYLINPQLGGTADIRNLWPEPYTSTIWNAHAKDALETRLHQMVCARQVDLADAQREIATDWISAYRKYFHTQSPA